MNSLNPTKKIVKSKKKKLVSMSSVSMNSRDFYKRKMSNFRILKDNLKD